MKEIKSVCIIDDDHIIIYGLQRLIHETSFCDNVMVYQNAEDALAGLKERIKQGGELPEIIFLDLNMPIMTGWEFLDRYLDIEDGDPGQSAVFILSSSVDPKDLMRIEHYDLVRKYVLKPITAEDLQQIKQEEGHINSGAQKERNHPAP